MTDPKPLTREELDAWERSDKKAPIPLLSMPRLFAMARRCLELEAKQKERDELERRRDEWLRSGGFAIGHTVEDPEEFVNNHSIELMTLYPRRLVVEAEAPSYLEALRDALSKLTTEKA